MTVIDYQQQQRDGQSLPKLHFAVIAGLCAAMGSLLGKISGSAQNITDVRKFVWPWESELSWDKDSTEVMVAQGITFGLMLLCNASVWTFYVRALQSCSSSLPATVVSTATNYVTSAVLGMVLFGEATTFLWWCGTLLVIIGLALIAKVDSSTDKHKRQ